MSSKGKIVVAGPDQMATMLLANYLSGLGYETSTSSDGVETLGLLEEHTPEAIVVQQIDEQSEHIVQSLNNAGIEIPVVVLATEDALDSTEKQENVTRVLSWPVARPRIAKVVDAVVEKQRATRLSHLTKSQGNIDTLPAAPRSDLIVRKIGRYRIESLIARGGMGDVYRCYDDTFERTVAVKTIRYGSGALHSSDDTSVERFRVEAAALSRLVHPHIVTTHDFGMDVDYGQMYLVMDFVDGPSLRYRLQNGGLSIKESLTITWNIADALAHAHERGVIHRDVKPENILINDLGEPLLTDFGLARLGNYSVSDGQVIAGTPNYMAPEQILSPKNVDERTDQYGLGAMLHELLTGKPSYYPEDEKTSLLGSLTRDRQPLTAFGVETSERLQEMLDRMLDKDQDRRFSHDLELLEAFAEVGRELELNFERSL